MVQPCVDPHTHLPVITVTKVNSMSLRDIILFMATCCSLSSLAGLAYLLRSGAPLSRRVIAAAILWNGLGGLAMASLGYHFLGDKNLYLLLGMSILAGIGSVSILDFLWQFLTGRISVTVKIDKPEKRLDD